MRARIALLASLLLVSACSVAEDIRDLAPSEPASGSSAASGGAPSTPAEDSTPGTGGGGAPGGPAEPGPSNLDAGPVGSLVRRYLRGSPAARMTVEVDFVAGRAPSGRALSHLQGVLREVADKPGGLSVAAGDEIASGRDSWSVADLRALERRHRSTSTRGDHASMWIVYVDGAYADDDSALGVAYAAGSAAIFRDRVNAAASALVDPASVERAVLTHEAGHLLALVNLGYDSPRDREDADHPNHSSNRDSVMYWAVEDVSVRAVLRGGPPDRFDADDKADLAMLKQS